VDRWVEVAIIVRGNVIDQGVLGITDIYELSDYVTCYQLIHPYWRQFDLTSRNTVYFVILSSLHLLLFAILHRASSFQ